MLLSRKEGEELLHYRFIHLATHGILGTDVPPLNQPALVLSGGRGLSRSATFLTMDEVFRLRLTAEMVVLSACQTGRGEEVPGEGIIGLTRAFLHAGTRSVVVSLWNVADDATAAFMSRFYYYLLEENIDKAHALQRVRLDFLKSTVDEIESLRQDQESKSLSASSISRLIAHPFFWAPFILVGEGK